MSSLPKVTSAEHDGFSGLAAMLQMRFSVSF